MKVLKFLSIMALTSVMITFTACNKSAKESTSGEAATTEATAMEIDQLLAEAESLAGQEVSIEGVCTHICKHGGAKIFLMGSDDTKTIRIESGNVGKFPQECVNNIVEVKGTLKESRIDEAYLVNWEERLAAQTAEKHGEGEAGCSTEQKARGEAPANSTEERIANYRTRIAERNEKEGKNYLSFYFVEASEYKIVE